MPVRIVCRVLVSVGMPLLLALAVLVHRNGQLVKTVGWCVCGWLEMKDILTVALLFPGWYAEGETCDRWGRCDDASVKIETDWAAFPFSLGRHKAFGSIINPSSWNISAAIRFASRRLSESVIDVFFGNKTDLILQCSCPQHIFLVRCRWQSSLSRLLGKHETATNLNVLYALNQHDYRD